MGVSVSETKPETRIADHDHDGKFVQQPADDSAQEQHGNEHGRERQGHRKDGEADFARRR